MANNFFSRWSQRKLDVDKTDDDIVSSTYAEKDDSNNEVLESQTEATKAEDLSSESKVSSEAKEVQGGAGDSGVENLDEDSLDTESIDEANSEEPEETSLAQLLASGAEAGAKKAAMRKLFLSGEFSEVDRLNDYDHDYSSVKSLSTEAASKLRNWVNEKLEEDEVEEEFEASDSNKELDSHGNSASNVEDDNAESESLQEENEGELTPDALTPENGLVLHKATLSTAASHIDTPESNAHESQQSNLENASIEK